MASRFMQGKREAMRRFSREVANESLTEAERKFFLDAGRLTHTDAVEVHQVGRARFTPVDKQEVLKDVRGVVMDFPTNPDKDSECLEDVRQVADRERRLPSDDHRALARLMAIPSVGRLPLDANEKCIFDRNPCFTIAQLATAILRYRKLTGRE